MLIPARKYSSTEPSLLQHLLPKEAQDSSQPSPPRRHCPRASGETKKKGKFYDSDPFADLFRPLQEIFGIVNATATAILRDVAQPSSAHSHHHQATRIRPSFQAAITKHEFKINEREGTVVETEARPPAQGEDPLGPVTAKIHMRETFYNPEKGKIETVTHEETVMVPLLPPIFSAAMAPIAQFDPSRITDTIERIALPFQRAFTNFTTELGLSIFKATHPTAESAGGSGFSFIKEKSDNNKVQSSATVNISGENNNAPAPPAAEEEQQSVSLGFYRPNKKAKKDKNKTRDNNSSNNTKPTVVAAAEAPFVIKEENVYPPKTESNLVSDVKP